MSYACMEKAKTERDGDVSQSPVLQSHSHEWGWLSFGQECCDQSLNEPQGPQTPGTGGATYDLAGKNGDQCSIPAVGCAFNDPLKRKLLADSLRIIPLVAYLNQELHPGVGLCWLQFYWDPSIERDLTALPA
ncbi:hypothetical protein AV530_016619 [Patagioenas fasciata monilis]|uniref:Uncharacterized protein n=1 Tax=Patagioenas fasciata monilis TaxID=372326 RepID=A0A1V4J2Y0_PATFA|nr:hypothetical protein AV530_016619 [Patagioenas fasciata monilis]